MSNSDDKKNDMLDSENQDIKDELISTDNDNEVNKKNLTANFINPKTAKKNLEEKNRLSELNNETKTDRFDDLFRNYNDDINIKKYKIYRKPDLEDEYKNDTDEKLEIYNLYDINDCIKFIKTKKTSKSLAYAMILCLYDFVIFNDLNILVNELYRELPQNINEEERIETENQDMYTSQYEFLNMLGAVVGEVEVSTKLGKISTKSVWLSQDKDQQAKSLENLWLHFPIFKNAVIGWLIHMIKTKHRILIKESIKALAKLIQIDYVDGISNIIYRLTTNEDNLYIIKNIIYEIQLDNKDYIHIDNLLNDWNNRQKGWLWKIPILSYIDGVKGEYIKGIEKSLDNLIENHLNDESEDLCDLEFIGTRLRYSIQFRDTVINVLNKTDNTLKYTSYVYIVLVFYSYISVNEEYPNMPLVVYDDDSQVDKILPILKYILSRKNTRMILFAILKDYLNEINEYDIEKIDVKKLKYFFYRIAFIGETYFSNIQWFLNNRFKPKCKIPFEISLFLSKILDSTKTLRIVDKQEDGNE